MTNDLMLKIVLIDYEIDKLVSMKKHIDIRLTELYEQREDVVVDFDNRKNTCGKGCCDDL